MAETTTTTDGTATTATSTTATTATTTAPTDWRAGLTGEYAPLATDKSLDVIKGKDWSEAGPALVKQYVNAQKLIGQKTDGLVKIPGANAKPDEVAAYHKAIGVPEKPDGYEFKKADGTPMTVVDEKGLSEARALFHRLGIPASAAGQLAGWYAQYQEDSLARTQQGYAKELQTIRDEWGEQRFLRGAMLGVRAVEHLGGDQFKAWLEETRLGDHPLLFQVFAKLGEQFSEDGVIDGRVEGVPTQDQAQARIAEIRDQVYKNGPGHPENQRLEEEMLSLYRSLPGGKAPVVTVAGA